MLLNPHKLFISSPVEGLSCLICVYTKNTKIILLSETEDKLKYIVIDYLEQINVRGKHGDICIMVSKNKYDFIILMAVEHKYKDRIIESAVHIYKILDDYNIRNVYIADTYIKIDIAHALILKSSLVNSFKEYDSYNFYIDDGNCKVFRMEIDKFRAEAFSILLAELPANCLTPTIFCEYAKAYLSPLENVEIKVCDESFLVKNNMNMILSVGQGSDQPTKMLVIEYKGSMADEYDIALVGKGITFDSGGISLKSCSNMRRQKKDMSGAAVILSAIGHTIKYKEEINLVAIIPLAENLPSGKALKPGDVIKSMAGKTVEISNTDAEGRLILGDALTFAQRKYKPEYIIDFSTLTGAMRVALGSMYSGVFSNNDDFYKIIERAAHNTNEFIWRMPLNKYFKKRLRSPVADIVNSIKGKGGAIFAASFLHEFVENNRKWAHVDMAGMKEGLHLKEVYGNRFQGRPTLMLIELLKILADEYPYSLSDSSF